MVIYVPLLILRFVTWSYYTRGSDPSRLIAVAGYLYGINVIFVSFRACGELTEANQSTGIIQIALFKIIKTIFVIIGQLVATLLAFSFAITKIYSAGKTASGKNSTTSGYVFNSV